MLHYYRNSKVSNCGIIVLPVFLKVWALDATPGKVRPGGDGEDHPGELIAFLSKIPKQVVSLFLVLTYFFDSRIINRQSINRPVEQCLPSIIQWCSFLAGFFQARSCGGSCSGRVL